MTNANNAIAGMANPIGHLTTSTSYVGGSGTDGNAYTDQIRGFNAFGEPTGETITIPASESTLADSYTHTYHPNTGLPNQEIYPANGSLPAETVKHGYDTPLDVPVDLGSTYMYTWDAFGRVGQTELGNNETSHAYITNTYDEHTSALKDTKLVNTAASSTPIDETSYTYDPAKNPTSQTETRQGPATETQCFGYDTLDRLAKARTATDN